MQYPKERIDEFKTIWKEVYGADLSDDEAQDYAGKLVHFVGLLIDGAERTHHWDEKLKGSPNG